MSPLWPLIAFVSALIAGWFSSRRAIRDPDPADLRENYRGAEVPVVLGGALVRVAGTATAFALVLALLAGPVRRWPVAIAALAGTVVLAWAGRLDDRGTSQERGLSGHLRSLVRGRPTTGIVKLLAGVAAAGAVAVAAGGGPLRIGMTTVLVALSVNVTNALDVRPGRALRWVLLVLVLAGPWLRASGSGIAVLASAYVGAGFAVWRHDLAERGMLGDAGSNPLGLVAGAALATVLPLWGLTVAVVVLLGLQVAAETVTISRLIDAVPPIRWFDRVGRRDPSSFSDDA